MTDLRSLFRRWRTAPLLPALAVLVLAVGVGTSTAVLGVAWAALLRPLPYPHPAQLVRVTAAFPRMQLSAMNLSSYEAFELGQVATVFEHVGFGLTDSVTVSAAGASVQASAVRVTASTLSTLAVTPRLGRLFSSEDDRESAPPVVVVSEVFWRNQLGGDRSAIGSTILVDGRAAQLIGVMPAAVDFGGDEANVWLPLHFEYRTDHASGQERSNHSYKVIARIKNGLTFEQAVADVKRATTVWAATTGQMQSPSPEFHPLALAKLDDVVRHNARPATLVLLAAVAMVLLIAGANASTLLIAQSEARRTEMAVRAALGADRLTLWRLHMMEAFILAGIATALAVLLAWGLGQSLAALAPEDLALRITALPLWQIGGIAIGVAGVTALACSLAPLGRLKLTRLVSALAAEGRGGTASAERHRLRRTLVAVEIAVAVTLFAGAALLVESFWRLTSVDPGFRPDGVVRARVYLPAARYGERAQIDGAYAAITARLRREPGVADVGLMSGLLPERNSNNTSLQTDVPTTDLHNVPPVKFIQFVDPNALAVLHLPIVRGRAFSEADVTLGAPVALLNQRAADAFFKGLDPVGHRVRTFGPNNPWMTVVGVAGNVHQAGLAEESGTEIFVPVAQAANINGLVMTRDLNVVIRVESRDPGEVAKVLRAAVTEAEPLAALSDVAVMRDVILDSVATPRFLAFVLSGFAGVALLLCAAGVYGIVTHAVSERTREIGVRRSLGAPSRAIVELVGRQVATLVGAGLAAGLVCAIAGTRALQSLTFHTPAVSVTRLAIVIIALAATAALACVIPLLRALKVDPATALRSS